MSDAIASRTTEEWLAAFEAADIPAMPVHTMASLLRDPHLEAIGFFGMVDHPSEGAVRMMAVPSRWSGTPPQPRGHAPRLGEHSVDVLKEAGYDDEAIAALVRNGAAIAAARQLPEGTDHD
ncbi:dehydratase/racemase [Bordetella pertussis]|nr:dehydratase/racemase [Bordetella pertussis]